MLAMAEYDVIVTRAHDPVFSRPAGLLAEIVEAVAVKLLGVFIDSWAICPHSGYTEGSAFKDDGAIEEGEGFFGYTISKHYFAISRSFLTKQIRSCLS